MIVWQFPSDYTSRNSIRRDVRIVQQNDGLTNAILNDLGLVSSTEREVLIAAGQTNGTDTHVTTCERVRLSVWARRIATAPYINTKSVCEEQLTLWGWLGGEHLPKTVVQDRVGLSVQLVLRLSF